MKWIKSMAPRLILFDLDNTLIDRQRSISVFVVYFIDKFGAYLNNISPVEIEQILKNTDGGGYTPRTVMFTRVISMIPWRYPPTIVELVDFWNQYFPQCSQIMDGAYDVLEYLRSKNIQVGIITNGIESLQLAKIEAVNLSPYIEKVVVSGALNVAKPDPEIFHIALSEFGLKPTDAWYVGDHPINDIVGAVSAGITGVWLKGYHSWPQDIIAPLVSIDSLRDIIGFSSNL